MIIVAKFASRCPACSERIVPGASVEWTKGSPARHADCRAAAAPLAASSAPSVASGRSVTVERVGRRSYLRGDTVAVRGLLRAGGCHWDVESRAWWIGSHDEALALAERARTAAPEAAPKKRITSCVGCGCRLDEYQQRRGMRFCSSECAVEKRMGSGWSGYVNGSWHQGSDD